MVTKPDACSLFACYIKDFYCSITFIWATWFIVTFLWGCAETQLRVSDCVFHNADPKKSLSASVLHVVSFGPITEKKDRCYTTVAVKGNKQNTYLKGNGIDITDWLNCL